MTSNKLLTPTLLCRGIVMLARNLPWQMKLGVPFHCAKQIAFRPDMLTLGIEEVVDNHLRPAVMAAMENRSPYWGRVMELPRGGGLISAREDFQGIACRLVIGEDIGVPRTMMQIDLEFSSTSCDVPLYYWLGEQAEAA